MGYGWNSAIAVLLESSHQILLQRPSLSVLWTFPPFPATSCPFHVESVRSSALSRPESHRASDALRSLGECLGCAFADRLLSPVPLETRRAWAAHREAVHLRRGLRGEGDGDRAG